MAMAPSLGGCRCSRFHNCFHRLSKTDKVFPASQRSNAGDKVTELIVQVVFARRLAIGRDCVRDRFTRAYHSGVSDRPLGGSGGQHAAQRRIEARKTPRTYTSAASDWHPSRH